MVKRLLWTLLASLTLVAAVTTAKTSAHYIRTTSSYNSTSATSSSSSNTTGISNATTPGLLYGATHLQFPETTRSSDTPAASSATSAQPITAGAYVALGDSVAAGAGLPRSANPTDRDRGCGRSPEAYPYQVAESVKLPLIHVACSGATARHVAGPMLFSSPQLPSAFASGTPALITITVGANDIRWNSFLQRCYTTMCGRQVDTNNVDRYLGTLRERLDTTFAKIQEDSNNIPPTVIVTGYYNPLSNQCTTLQSRVTGDELSWLSAQLDKLNQTLVNASMQYSFVRFAPVDFSGHDICSTQPWVQGLNAAAPFHPTAQGQTAIAEAVLRAY